MSDTEDLGFSVVPSIKHVGYASLSVLTLMLYDVLLTLPLDYDFVWRDLTKSFSTTKAFYIVCRYGALVNAILYVLVAFPPTHHSKSWCIGLYAPIVVILLCVEACGHCMVLFKIFILWGRNEKIKRIMIFIASISYAVACAMMIKFLGPITKKTFFIDEQFDGGLHILACADEFDPKLAIGLFTPAVFMDGCAILLMWWNALDQPRAKNAQVMKILEHDGVVLLAAGFCLRLSNILITSTGNISLVLMVGFTLEFVNAVLNVRLFLKLRESTERPTSLSDELVCDLYDNNSEESFGIALWRLRQGAEEVPVIPATINDQ
ncbi:hypothetical protein SCHPADRAFT_1001621 [Schizopora paradoxa]|uniref:DUF6533 domain-containing protein n=1 Tax=Schizopora paradoxa TaxID=27342 RepID=A0A0H2R6P4_9AGAM|nr:hypothetical protein SCHPADRAFT_1001621 [Schizopora paradoxa]